MLSPGDPVVRDFLRRTMVVEVATLSAKGRPFVTPLWFVAAGGTLYLTTGPATWAGRNVAVHPEVALLFNGEHRGRPDQVLRLRGTATCHTGLPPWRALLRLALKYYLSPRGLLSELRHAPRWRLRRMYYGQAKGGFGYIRVVPGGGEVLPRP
jgi:hypothetical protein